MYLLKKCVSFYYSIAVKILLFNIDSFSVNMPPKRTSKFKPEWLTDPKFSSWLAEHDKSSSYAVCTFCKVDIHVGSMRIGALMSHYGGAKHQSRFNAKLAPSIANFFTSTKSASQPSNQSSLVETTPKFSPLQPDSPHCLVDHIPNSAELPTPASVTQTKLSLIPDSILTSEIYWSLHVALNHQSFRSNDNISTLFKKMFPDSEIAKQFTCGRKKCSYLINFGLAPYFSNELISKLQKVSHYVILFDESYNSVTKSEQMDFHVRFWDADNNCTITRYLSSQFLTKGDAETLLKHFKEATSELDPSKLLQISMDGPNVNLKFHRMCIKDQKENEPEGSPSLLDLGVCGLHVLHGAFKTGVNSTGWKLDGILRSLWYLFHDTYSRRTAYTEITGSDLFPLQFVATRWTEDLSVAERAIEIWPNIGKYIKKVSSGPKSKRPNSASYVTIVNAVNDPLILAKLHTFVAVAKDFNTFLLQFQSNKPMAPLIFREMGIILCSLLEKFISKSVMKDSTVISMLSIDLSEDGNKNFKKSKYVDLSFCARHALSEAKVSEAKEIEFKWQCLKLYAGAAQKIAQRSALKYKLVQNLDCLNPRTIASLKSTELLKKFDGLLEELVEKKVINLSICDAAGKEYSSLVSELKLTAVNECREFGKCDNQRLDKFYGNYLGTRDSYAELWKVLKIVLILSHGQADVERGFSVNKDILKCNMGEKSIVALRQVNDAMNSTLGEDYSKKIDQFVVTKEVLSSCKSARMRYTLYLEEIEKSKKLSLAQKRKLELKDRISASEEKKRKLEREVDRLKTEADKLAVNAQEERSFSLLETSNSLRERALKFQEDVKEEEKKLRGHKDVLKTL